MPAKSHTKRVNGNSINKQVSDSWETYAKRQVAFMNIRTDH